MSEIEIKIGGIDFSSPIRILWSDVLLEFKLSPANEPFDNEVWFDVSMQVIVFPDNFFQGVIFIEWFYDQNYPKNSFWVGRALSRWDVNKTFRAEDRWILLSDNLRCSN